MKEHDVCYKNIIYCIIGIIILMKIACSYVGIWYMLYILSIDWFIGLGT